MADSLRTFAAMTRYKDVPLTLNEGFSGVFGMISLLATIFITLPQLVENYRAQSASGVSMLFLLIWCVGDVANLSGALWAGLVPAVIAIGVYYCISDVVLIGQCVYYNVKNKRREKQLQEQAKPDGTTSSAVAQEQEDYEAGGARDDEPLLSRRESHQSTSSNPGRRPNRRRRSSAGSRPSMNGHVEYGTTMAKIAEDHPDRARPSKRRQWLKNTVSILVICVLGVVVWLIAYKTGAWKPTPAPGEGAHNGDGEGGEKSSTLGAEILGYISAAMYLGARIPQIIKNYRSKSCEGLSLLFFILSLISNLTYGASILFHSVEPNYVITNVPWLIGSLGTMFEDITIFVQFHIYGDREAQAEGGEEADANGSASAVV